MTPSKGTYPVHGGGARNYSSASEAGGRNKAEGGVELVRVMWGVLLEWCGCE